MASNAWRSVPQSIRDQLRLVVFARDDWHCRIRGPHCKHRGPTCHGCAEDLDHIIPLDHGGAVLDPGNCRAACATCNRGRRVPRRRSPPEIANPSREW